jgi:hypothetical protein
MLGLASLLGRLPGEPEQPRREPGVYLVRLVDGGRVRLQLLTEDIEIATAYGMLKVPIAEVRRIDVGLRYPEGVERRVQAAVARVGDADPTVREAAGNELLRFQELALPGLRRAAKSDDLGVKRRASALLRQLEGRLSSGQLEVQDDDFIVTARFPITGRIGGLAVKARSPALGEVQLRWADTRQIRLVEGESEPVDGLLPYARATFPQRSMLRSPERGVYEVRLADGGLLDMRLISKEIAIATREGKREVPVADVRRIDVGFRYPEGMQKRVEAAVARLGDSQFKIRESAGKDLLRLREVAYPALLRAAKSDDPEIKRRATALVRQLEGKLTGEQWAPHDDDVIVTTRHRLVGRIEGLALKAASPVFGEVQLRLADTREVRSLTAELAAARSLLDRVGEAVGGGHITRSQRMGTGTGPYEEVPRGGALLIGFEVTYGRFANNPTVTTVRPIFLTRDGRLMGTTHGLSGEGRVRVEAKRGYAVGAVTIKAGLGVDGMSVTFMEIREGGLNPKRAYESAWLGGMGGGPKTKLAGGGTPVVGIFGATADGASTFNGLGPVTSP